MKKIYSLVVMTVIAITVNAQLVVRENFSGFTTGALSNQGGWVQKGTGTDVQVSTTTPLNKPNYTSGFTYITVGTTDGRDPWKPFSTAVTTGTAKTIFTSFLVRVTFAEEANGGPVYSLALRDTNSTLANIPCRFYIANQNGAGNTNIQFGIAVGSSTPAYTNANFVYGQTYLIVIRYDIVTGANNDRAYLWVDPATTAEPSTAAATGNTGANQTGTGEATYGSTLQALQIFQSSTTGSPNAAYDGFLVAEGTTSFDAWNNLNPAGAPLPVVLTSFNAANEGLSTKLSWGAADESGLASYVIEKSTDGRTFTSIGSVNATNQKAYSFIDGAASDNSYYRLKMVDLNGTVKYSYVVSIKSKVNATISLSPNPVKNNLIIQHPKVTTESNIQVISANGQLVKTIRLASNAVISYVDMSGFNSGLYHIVYKSGSDMFTKTVIKQ